MAKKTTKSITLKLKKLPNELKTNILVRISPETAFKVLSVNSKLFKEHVHILVKELKPYEILKLASKSKLNKNELRNVLAYIFEKFKLHNLTLTLCGGCTILERQSKELCGWHHKYHECHLGKKGIDIGDKFNIRLVLPIYKSDDGDFECIDHIVPDSPLYDSDDGLTMEEQCVKTFFDSFICDLCGAPDPKGQSNFCPGCLHYRRFHISYP